ncbi:MAG: hypothetical protein EBZ47_06870 [Chlamydiae bacterium]|nr:hypothetical protein [Chlamydiota bacterium]
MFTFFYDIGIFLYTIAALFWMSIQKLRKGKYKDKLSQLIRCKPPVFERRPGAKVIWIHTISMGETRAAVPIFDQLKNQYPDLDIVISTFTETGQVEAKKSMPGAKAYFFLPFDFSWLIKLYMKKIRPDYLMMMESDFWCQLVLQAKRFGAKVLLVNGKISPRSHWMISTFAPWMKRMFTSFDQVCVQNQEYAHRFFALGCPKERITVTGNLKIYNSLQSLPNTHSFSLKEHLSIDPYDNVIVIGSTHQREEAALLSSLDTWLRQNAKHKLILAPRHPERFKEVALLMRSLKISYRLFSDLGKSDSHAQVTLMDTMGVLRSCYEFADLAIVGGSFFPSVGGHNIFEPIQRGTPVLFGPYMHSQKDLKDLCLQYQAGALLPLDQVASFVQSFFSDLPMKEQMRAGCMRASSEGSESLHKTWEVFNQLTNT